VPVVVPALQAQWLEHGDTRAWVARMINPRYAAHRAHVGGGPFRWLRRRCVACRSGCFVRLIRRL